MTARRIALMRFAVMTWVRDNVKSGSIFGILDKDNPGKLPSVSPLGHWADFRVIDENRFKFANDAKKAIAAEGYYLMGASVSVTEAFGEPPKR
jgi:hypothetical protein